MGRDLLGQCQGLERGTLMVSSSISQPCELNPKVTNLYTDIDI